MVIKEKKTGQKRIRMIRYLFYTMIVFHLMHPKLEAQNLVPSEYQVKAAYLYQFTKFVEWPDSASVLPNDFFVIGVLGQDPFGEILDQTMMNKFVKGRKIVIRRYRDFRQVGRCHILYICTSEKKRMKEILGNLNNLSVLTVADLNQFASHGGITEFVNKENKILFRINIDAAEKMKLQLSSKLLKLAEIVRTQ